MLRILRSLLIALFGLTRCRPEREPGPDEELVICHDPKTGKGTTKIVPRTTRPIMETMVAYPLSPEIALLDVDRLTVPIEGCDHVVTIGKPQETIEDTDILLSHCGDIEYHVHPVCFVDELFNNGCEFLADVSTEVLEKVRHAECLCFNMMLDTREHLKLRIGTLQVMVPIHYLGFRFRLLRFNEKLACVVDELYDLDQHKLPLIFLLVSESILTRTSARYDEGEKAWVFVDE